MKTINNSILHEKSPDLNTSQNHFNQNLSKIGSDANQTKESENNNA